MGLDFNNYTQKEIGKLKKRKKSYRKLVIYTWISLSLVSILAFLLNKYLPQSANYSDYFSFGWFTLIVIIVYVFSTKSDIQLSFKEQLLFNLSEGVKHLSNFNLDRNDRELRTSKKYFNSVINDMQHFSGYNKGFQFENDVNESIDNTLLLFKREITPKLDVDLSKEDYSQIYQTLLTIFMELQDEKFKELRTHLDRLTKSDKTPRKIIGSAIQQIRSSNILMVLTFAFAVIVLDLIALFIFSILHWKYNHTSGIVIIIAFIAGIKPTLDFLKSIKR